MCHDNSLNEDVHKSGRSHVVMSRSGVRYGEKDPRMFSFATPKEVARVYKRINDPDTGVVPKPEQIVQDIEKSVQAMAIIHKVKGAFVTGLASGRVAVHRHRYSAIKISNNIGGYQPRKEYDLNLTK